MRCSVNLMAAISLCLVIGLCCCDPLPLGQENASRPVRPKVFTSPDELRKYLEDLSDFYAYAGRPRFGKRLVIPAGLRTSGTNGASGMSAGGPTSAEALNFRYFPAASDLYDLLFQYDE